MDWEKFKIEEAGFSFGLCTVGNLIDDARELMKFSETAPDVVKSTMYASTVVLLTSALEQGTYSHLNAIAEQQALVDLIDVRTTRFYNKINASLSHRIRVIPELFSDNHVKLNNFNADVKKLFEMVTLRNNLVHHKDFFIAGKLKDLQAKGVNVVEVPGRGFELVIPDSFVNVLWRSVNRTDAQKYVRIVNRYIEEILYPCSDLHFGFYEESLQELVDKLRKSDMII